MSINQGSGFAYAGGSGGGGGGTSLTATQVAFGSPANTVTSSSAFFYDTTNSLYNLGFSGVGMSIDEGNSRYAFGDISAIKQGIQLYINNNTGIALAALGDVDAVGNGTALQITDAIGVAEMGDVNNVSNGVAVVVDNLNNKVTIGDVNATTNGTQLYIDIANSVATLGDVRSVVNGTTVTVDDSLSTVSIANAISSPTFTIYKSGSGSVTIPRGVRGLIYDPASTNGTAVIKLTQAEDGTEIMVVFGGQINTGLLVVQALSFVGSGAAVLGNIAASAYSGDVYLIKYIDKGTPYWYVSTTAADVPYIGANRNVVLGANNISSNNSMTVC